MSDSAGRHDGIAESAKAYARGAAGALLVAMPLLMTMEMWWNGFYMPPLRLLVFYVVNFGILLVLEHYSGFREDESFLDEVGDAIVALGIGTVVAAITLTAMGVITFQRSWTAVTGMIIIQSIPLSIGASVAISLLAGQGDDEEKQQQERQKRSAGFWGTQLMGLAGALYFGFNVAPTEEPMLIGLRMSPWNAIALLALSLIIVHAMVYAVGFRGTEKLPGGRSWWSTLLQMGSVSYLFAALTALFLLWAFGRVGPGVALIPTLKMTITLAFATSLGAAAGRLIL